MASLDLSRYMLNIDVDWCLCMLKKKKLNWQTIIWREISWSAIWLFFFFFCGVLVVVNTELVSIGLPHIWGLLLTWTSHVHLSLFPKRVMESGPFHDGSYIRVSLSLAKLATQRLELFLFYMILVVSRESV